MGQKGTEAVMIEIARLEQELAKLREEHDAALSLAYARAATAEQRAEKLSEELEQVKHLLTCESIKAERAENRAEAAEARIKEAEGQEHCEKITAECARLEVSNESLAHHIAELERKLAKQQAVLLAALEAPSDVETETILMDWRNGADKRPVVELNALLAKARTEAVPDAIPAIPPEQFREWVMHNFPDGTIIGSAEWWVSRLWGAATLALADATKLGEEK